MSKDGEFVFHARTKAQLDSLRAQPTHAVAIVGDAGIGKHTIANILAAELLNKTAHELTKHPYLLVLNAEGQTISIETMRRVQQFTQLKTLGDGAIRRVIVLLDAGRMTTEAQNAFLKLLEEPPADTALILTVESEASLLPTIMSRVQKLVVHPVAEATLREHFATMYDTSAIEKAYFLSGGLPGLMHALLEGDQAHPLIPAVTEAKAILQAKTFERLALTDGLSKKKDELPYILQALRQIAETGRNQASKQQDTARIARWHQIIRAVYEAESALAQNANTKLVLTNLMLAL